MRKSLAAVLLLGIFVLPAPAKADIPNDLRAIADRLVGVLSTAEQARSNAEAPDVRMITCEVTVADRPAATEPTIFLYQEQALRDRPEQPYRQRFLRLSPTESGAIESAGFEPSDREAWVNFCQQTERSIRTADLGKHRCSIFLQPVGNDYLGETPPGGCPANFRGATHITNRVWLMPDGMETWDRGLDDRGNQVWGAEGEPYRFQKVR